MAVRVPLSTPITVDGQFLSVDVRLPSFIQASKYQLSFIIVNASELIDPSKSISVFIEALNEGSGLWEIMGGAHWRGGMRLDKSGNPVTPSSTITLTTWRTGADGTINDLLSGKRVRIRAHSPAIEPDLGTELFPGTTGPITIRFSISDNR